MFSPSQVNSNTKVTGKNISAPSRLYVTPSVMYSCVTFMSTLKTLLFLYLVYVSSLPVIRRFIAIH